MIKINVHKTLLSFLLILFICVKITGQNQEQKQIPLSVLLNKISNKHKIFFTYNVNLLLNKFIYEEGFKDLSLEESISLLEKLTPFVIDDLGNNYYVVYYKKDAESVKSKDKNKPTFRTNVSLDTIYKGQKITVKGIVLSSDNTPLTGATLQEENSLVGITTNKDGIFEFDIPKNNLIKVSFLGHESKKLTLTANKFHTITLLAGQELEEVKIVGSRNKNRVLNDSPVAIDFIDLKKTASKNSQIEVNQFLQYVIPSFNATKQSGADGADHIDPATIRGLGPDQTLVLINGKRRHQASLVNLYGTRGRGNSGTDLNAIPISAIKRIELLRDGASAQYGSDAIAGVLNIVLKDSDNELNVGSTIGFYNADTESILPNKTDGFLYKLALNYGTKINKGGFVNITAEALSSDKTYRKGTEIRENYGQAGIKNVSLFFNSEIPIHNNAKFYANGGFNYKNTEAFAFTRKADSERNVLEIYPDGFNPLITSQIVDNSFSFGLITSFKNWNIDANNTFGRNNFHYFIKNTLNATLVENSPTDFDAGGHQLMQNTTSIDFSKYFLKDKYGFNIALGVEHRLDKYKIFAGEEASYESYDVNGNSITPDTQFFEYQMLNGVIRPGGSQGFPGYAIENEVDRDRSNFGVYVDTEVDFSKKFMIAGALRYEYYSDFGSTLNYKLASRIKLNNKFSARTSFSTGFRAPSLAQIYYNLTFTNFIGNVATESLLVANNSAIARRFNIDKLKEEKAKNFSLGFTSKLSSNFNMAVDAYYVAIKDRIILSGNFDASILGGNIDNVQFFANGVNTKTTGVDLVLNWQKKIKNGLLSFDFAGNINHMVIEEINNKMLAEEIFFGQREQQFLLASAPKNKFSFGANYQLKKITTALKITRFSEVKLIDWQITNDLADYNNSASERLAAATDTYKAKVTTDLHLGYQLYKTLNLQAGANNLFNVYPTEQDNFTDSGGKWDATQMGANGAFYYLKFNINL